MAEIRIVRKTPVVLPWLIGLGLVLLVAALWVAWATDETGVVSDSAPPQQFLPREPAAALPADVAAYQMWRICRIGGMQSIKRLVPCCGAIARRQPYGFVESPALRDDDPAKPFGAIE